LILDNIDTQYFLQVHGTDTIGNISSTDISVSCPLCHEGKSWKRKHRMHLYIKPTYELPAVHCWNCGYSSNLYGYLKEYYPSTFEQYKKAKSSKSFKELKISNKRDLPTEDEKSKNIDIAVKVDSALTSPNTPNEDNVPNVIEPLDEYFTKIPKDALDYLYMRGISPLDSWLYSPRNNHIKFEGKDILLSEYIIIPFLYNNKWYGFQALGWKQKRFFIYLVKGNSSWKVWNYFNVDRTKEVYIFESIYDALSSGLDNVVSQLGATISSERLSEFKEPVFCLDNYWVDERAKIELEEYSKKYKVFLWPEEIPTNIKDFNDLVKKGISKEKIKTMIVNNIGKGISTSLKIKMAN